MSTHKLVDIAVDPVAFEAFYRANVDAIQRFFARRVDDPYLVADLTADAFLAAMESATSYRPDRGSPRAWLFGIGRIVLLDERRNRARERRALRSIAARRLLDGDDLARVHEEIDAAAQSRALYLALRRLPPSERAVLELVALDGLDVTEAARLLSIRPTSARVRLHRARKTLALRADLQPLEAYT